MDCVIFDLDSTLADISHRMHYIETKPKNFRAFYKACVNDRPIHEMILLNNSLERKVYIFICTGRSDEVRSETEAWLSDNGVHYDTLLMRADGDYRPDYEVKKDMIERIRKLEFNILMAFDDRNRVVDMYRADGIRCLQVCEGNF